MTAITCPQEQVHTSWSGMQGLCNLALSFLATLLNARHRLFSNKPPSMTCLHASQPLFIVLPSSRKHANPHLAKSYPGFISSLCSQMPAQNQHLFLCLSPDALAPSQLPLGASCVLLSQTDTQAWTSKGQDSPQKLLVGCKSQSPPNRNLNTRHEKPSSELLVRTVQETPKIAQATAIVLAAPHPGVK